MTANVKIDSQLVRSHKIMQASKLFQAWTHAKDIAEALGHNAMRDSLINTTYRAYIAYLDQNEELYDAQESIKHMAASVQ